MIGDDPTTPNVVEPSQPFMLGVQVHNVGGGEADNLTITSAQPQIVDNQKGLDINYSILGSQLNAEAGSESLTVDFGNVAGGSTETADWFLESSLQGKFIDYSASFTNVNPLGLTESSIIQSVQIHELIHGGDVDGDGIVDFLANDIPDLLSEPDTLYLSDGATAPVTVIGAAAQVTLDQDGTLAVMLSTPAKAAEWDYFDVIVPADLTYTIASVTRADGTALLPGQYWFTDRTFTNAATEPTYEDRIHILDDVASPSYLVTFTKNAAPGVNDITLGLTNDTGASPVDKITADDRLFGTGAPDAIVRFALDGTAITDTAAADDSGNWNFTPTGLADGTHTIVASETDSAGNTGSASLTFILQTAFPAVTEAPASFTTAANGSITTTQAVIDGTADPNATIAFVLDGKSIGVTATADATGAWQLTMVALANGVHTLIASDTDSAGNTGIASLTFTLAAPGAAAASVLTQMVSFGNVRLGATDSQTITVTNSATAPAASLAVTTSTSGAALANGSISNLAPGASDSTDITIGLRTDAAGLQTGTVTLGLSSDYGNGDVTANPAGLPLSVAGAVFRPAAGTVALAQSIVHVGDEDTLALIVSNTDPADGFSEGLRATVVSSVGALTATGAIGLIAAGESDHTGLSVSFSTAVAGTQSGGVVLDLKSDGAGTSGLAVEDLGDSVIPLAVTVDNYATATIVDRNDIGTLFSNGNAETLDLGTIDQGAAAPTIDLGILNRAIGLADLLSGSIDIVGSSAFENTGFSAFAGLIAGGSGDDAPTVSLDTTNAGVFTETITLHATGSNASGYAGALADQTLTITGDVQSLAPAVATIETALPIALGKARVGGPLATLLAIANSATAPAQGLDVAGGGVSGDARVIGSISNLQPGAQDKRDIAVEFDTATAGTRTGTATLDFTSVSPLGTTALAPLTIMLTGAVYREAMPVLGSLASNLVVHVGDAAPTLSISNAVANDGYSERLLGTVTATTGAITLNSTVGPVAPGGTVASGGLFSTTTLGTIAGSLTLDLQSDGTGIDGFGPTDLGRRSIAIDAAVDNYAIAALVETAGPGVLSTIGNDATLDLGTIAQNIGIVTLDFAAMNDAVGLADLLSGSFSVSGDAAYTNNGFASFSGLAAGQSDSTPLVTLDTARTGKVSETIMLHSMGSNASGYAQALGDQTLTIIADVELAPAQARIDMAASIALGNVRVGGALTTNLGISNVATAPAAGLDASIGDTSGDAIADGTIINLGPGMQDGSDIKVGLSSARAGAASGTVTLALDSTSAGVSTPLAPQSVTLTGTVYREAAAVIAALPAQFVLHVGDVAPTLSIANIAANDGYSEDLTGTAVATSGDVTASGSLGTIAPGGSNNTIALFSTAAAGVIAGTVTLDLQSNGGSIDDLGTVELGLQTVNVDAAVDNYASASLAELSGPGTLSQSGDLYTLDLGAIAQGIGPVAINLAVLNSAAGVADLLAGSFAIAGGTAFTNRGFNTFSGLGAGAADALPTVTLDTTKAGTFTETVTLAPSASNASGYAAMLTSQTLTITGTVQDFSETWIAPYGGDWNTASNWSGDKVPAFGDSAYVNLPASETVSFGGGDATLGTTVVTGGAGFDLTGGAFTISGTAAFGPVTISSGTLVVLSGAKLSSRSVGVSNSGQLLIDSSSVLASVAMTGGTLSVGGGVTLSTSSASFGAVSGYNGQSEVDGPGTLASSGTTTVNSYYTNPELLLGGGIDWVNTGTVNDAGRIEVGDASGATATLINKAGAMFDLTGDDASIQNNGFYVSGNYQIGSSTFSNAGTLEKTAGTGTSQVYAALTNTGVIDAASGILELDGGGTLGGTIEGVGTLALGGGTFSVNAASLSLGNLLVDGGNATLAVALSSALNLVETSGSLALDVSSAPASVAMTGGTLSVGGGVTLSTSSASFGADGGYNGQSEVDGPGTLASSGTTTVNSYYTNPELLLGGGIDWVNTGTVNDAGRIEVGDASGATATLINKAGAMFDLTGDDASIINNPNAIYTPGTGWTSGNSTLINAGTLEKTGGTGTSEIYSALTNAGTIDVDSGTLQLDGGATLGGTLVGSGVLKLRGGMFIAAGAPNAASGTEVLFDGGLLALAANTTLNLESASFGAPVSYTGTSEVDGPGTLASSGTTTVNSYYTNPELLLGGGIDWVNTGTVNDAGQIEVGDASGATATLTNQAGATFDLTSDNASIINNPNAIYTPGTGWTSGNSTLINAGTLEKTGGTGTSEIYSALTNAGIIDVDSGTLQLDGGGFTNDGIIAINAGTLGLATFAGGAGMFKIGAAASLELNGGSSSGQTVKFLASTGALTLDHSERHTHRHRWDAYRQYFLLRAIQFCKFCRLR